MGLQFDFLCFQRTLLFANLNPSSNWLCHFHLLSDFSLSLNTDKTSSYTKYIRTPKAPDSFVRCITQEKSVKINRVNFIECCIRHVHFLYEYCHRVEQRTLLRTLALDFHGVCTLASKESSEHALNHCSTTPTQTSESMKISEANDFRPCVCMGLRLEQLCTNSTVWNRWHKGLPRPSV